MAAPFSNEPIRVGGLPRLRDDAFVPVDPRYLRVRLSGVGFAAAAVLAGGLVAASLLEDPIIPLAIAAGILVVLGISALFSVAEVRRLGYQIREHDLSLRSGVIRHSVETLPFARVQHVNISRGPVERALGLATLDVSSAGPDISIPGLAEDEAARIKLLVTQRAGALEDDDGDDRSGLGDGGSPP